MSLIFELDQIKLEMNGYQQQKYSPTTKAPLADVGIEYL